MAMNIQLLGVIQKMQAEINRLETENHALRTKLIAGSERISDSEGDPEREREEEVANLGKLDKVPRRCPAPQHDGVSTHEASAVQEHPGNVMIVRRYSIPSPTHSLAKIDPWDNRKRYANDGILEVRETVKSLECSSSTKEEKEEKMVAADSITSQRPSPEHRLGGRDKIKTVSFLLPVDMSAYSKPLDPLECSPDQATNELSTIAE
ncbi:putative coiled-coil domain-containing protein 195 [Sorex fumeus]|uniref:putative coiled-coil domain-containing protein 195 n=1 Tax=Sorex fumeus TaxID=62283 RepID=UPI0024AD5F6E|nr:putative coiled-coil domain-containing protein 195 [Sorex fumeus]